VSDSVECVRSAFAIVVLHGYTMRWLCHSGRVTAAAVLLTFCRVPVSIAGPADTSDLCIGAVTTYSADEIVPGIGVGGATSWYSGELAINGSVLLRDPYNENAKNFSPMGLYSLGAVYVVGGVFHVQDVGVTFRKVLEYVVGIPLVAMNSRHHFWFLGDPRPTADRSIRAALFVTSRTDVYSSHGDPWWRYCPSIGVELDIALSTPRSEPAGRDSSGMVLSQSSIALDLGVDKAFDLVNDRTITNTPRVFAGVRFYFARISQVRVGE
jgi:hypothetical protein